MAYNNRQIWKTTTISNKKHTTMNNSRSPQTLTADHNNNQQQQHYSGEILQQESAEIVTLALSPAESEATLSLIGEVVISDHELPTFDINNEISFQTDLTMENINGIEEDD